MTKTSAPMGDFSTKMETLYSLVETRRAPMSRSAWERSAGARQLRRLAKDHPFVRQLIELGLDNSASSDRPRFALEPLVRLLKDESRVVSLIARELNSPSRSRRRGAALILSSVAPLKAVPSLLKGARSSSDSMVRCFCLSALNVCALTSPKIKKELLPLAISFIKKASQSEKIAGLNSFQLHGDKSLISHLKPLLTSQDGLVKQTAKELHDSWTGMMKSK